MSSMPTVRELHAALTRLIQEKPHLADLPIYGYDDGTINLDGFDDVIVHTPDELDRLRRHRAGDST